ncbi:hypothetical protein KR093_001553 [Drosophila rubida]|uniref:Myb/SANT-like DNA-binding domain-containing protein n=1 Tax=Drosophila rubida TaxID=30044 RepID=A0AAD4JQV9_9MUSC|nr:hypothetical protein KR093_001553 [Drosophila rubida]
MSVKSSARIKKRRSAEAAAATATAASSGSFAAVSSQQRLGLVAGGNNSGNANATPNGNQQQQLNKKHNFVGRNPNFDTDETKLLIQLWGDPKLQRTLITTHKKHAVICQLAAKMQEYGYHRSPEEITTRIKNLKCFYNRLKKDKECGLTGETEPSWKHFAEMDAIMTRPIFSVRPNEVPAPSLKYQLEQALEEHAERRKRRQENGEEMSDSENEEDDMLLSSLVPNGKGKRDAAVNDGNADVQLDMDASEETFVSHAGDKRAAAKRRKLSSEPEIDVDESAAKELPRIKTEQQEPATDSAAAASTATVAAAAELEEDDDCMLLPLPKEEPIDVDAVDESSELSHPEASNGGATTSTATAASATRVMPTLADMLQLPKATNLLPFSGANVIIPANSMSNSVAQVNSAVSTSSSKITAGKISLVPTNFLMQPKQASTAAAASKGVAVGTAAGTQLQLLQSAINQGARLMISGAAPTPVQAATNTGLVTGPGGVKFVLVNAEQAAAAKVAAAVKTNANSVAAAAAAAVSLPQQQQQQPKLLQQTDYTHAQQQHQQQQQQQQQAVQQPSQQPLQQQQEKKEEKRRAQEKAREEQQSKRHMTTMRIMLRQLLNAQNEANEIQHNRLSLERERLDWEKSMGERLLTLLPSLLQPAAATVAAAGNTVQAASTHQSPQFIVSGAAAGSAGQRLQPPKLLFTTALPMANGTVSMPHILTPSSALATSLPKVIAAPATSSSSAAGNVTAATAGGAIVAKPVEICTQINDIQLVTPKLEKEG